MSQPISGQDTRKPRRGGKILCFLSFPVRFSLRLPVRFRSFCSRFGSDVYRFWLAVLFFLRPAGRFLCVRERNREQITVEQKFISGCQRGRGCVISNFAPPGGVSNEGQFLNS